MFGVGMKAVLISQKKPIGNAGFVILFFVLSGLFWYLNQIFNFFDLLLDRLKPTTLPDYTQYILIALSALLSAYILKSIIRYYQLKKLKLIVFSVNIALDGSYHYVQAPAAQTTTDFVKLFFSHLIKSTEKDKYSTVLNQYFPMLEIRRNDALVRCDAEQTLADAGLKNGDICQIVGKPKSTL